VLRGIEASATMHNDAQGKRRRLDARARGAVRHDRRLQGQAPPLAPQTDPDPRRSLRMAIKDDIVTFLRGDASIKRINFAFGTFKVYPSAYHKDVADAIDSGEIKVRTRGASSAASGASYDMNYDSLELSPTFSATAPRDQGFLVHECTHAHLDIQEIGMHSAHENEAVAYLAEAIFLEALGRPPLGSETIRVVSHGIARLVLGGTYSVSSADAAALTAEVAKHPHYATTVSYNSNGFKRSLVHRILR
jgi:hypothetical protein